MTHEVIGFAGLGAMGKPMAMHLAKWLRSDAPSAAGIKADPTLHVYNRDKSKTAPFTEDPELKSQCCDLKGLSDSCTIVFSMLAEDNAVRSVITQLLYPGGNHQGKVIVECSTVLPETAEELSALAASVGATYLSCPVFGRPDAAAAARLMHVLAGPAAARARVLPFLGPMTRRVVQLGDVPSHANAMKLVGNFHIISIAELLGEGMTLAEKCGVTRDQYVDVITDLFPGPILGGYATRLAKDEFTAGSTGFNVGLGLKDVGHMRKMAEKVACPLPLADLAFGRLLSLKASGRGELDWGAVGVVAREQAGLPGGAPEPSAGTSGSK